jgi:hypothetical protein
MCVYSDNRTQPITTICRSEAVLKQVMFFKGLSTFRILHWRLILGAFANQSQKVNCIRLSAHLCAWNSATHTHGKDFIEILYFGLLLYSVDIFPLRLTSEKISHFM